MKVREVEHGLLITLERGEKVMASLVSLCEERGIKAGFLWGLGAIKNAEIGYYSLETREYFFKAMPEDREVASMTGNVALVDGKPFIHAHAALSAMDDSLSCVGAHIKEAEVAVTLEVYLTPFQNPVARAYDEGTGLKLMDL